VSEFVRGEERERSQEGEGDPAVQTQMDRMIIYLEM
jgi:hypothetical protein